MTKVKIQGKTYFDLIDLTKDSFSKSFKDKLHRKWNYFWKNHGQYIVKKIVIKGGFPIKIETKISLLISYSFAIFII